MARSYTTRALPILITSPRIRTQGIATTTAAILCLFGCPSRSQHPPLPGRPVIIVEAFPRHALLAPVVVTLPELGLRGEAVGAALAGKLLLVEAEDDDHDDGVYDAGTPHAEDGENYVEDEVDITASDAGDGTGGYCGLGDMCWLVGGRQARMGVVGE